MAESKLPHRRFVTGTFQPFFALKFLPDSSGPIPENRLSKKTGSDSVILKCSEFDILYQVKSGNKIFHGGVVFPDFIFHSSHLVVLSR